MTFSILEGDLRFILQYQEMVNRWVHQTNCRERQDLGNKLIPEFKLETLMVALTLSPAEILKLLLKGPDW